MNEQVRCRRVRFSLSEGQTPEALKQELQEAGITPYQPQFDHPDYVKLHIDVRQVGTVLRRYPLRASLEFLHIKWQDSRALNVDEVDDLMFFEIPLKVLEVEPVLNTPHFWSWKLVIAYTRYGKDYEGIIYLNKAADCEKIVVPASNYVLKEVITEHSQGGAVLTPVHIEPSTNL